MASLTNLYLVPKPTKWVEERFLHITPKDPKFENSIYGPLNGVAGEIFPVARRFIVKPQGILRIQYALATRRGETVDDDDYQPELYALS